MTHLLLPIPRLQVRLRQSSFRYRDRRGIQVTLVRALLGLLAVTAWMGLMVLTGKVLKARREEMEAMEQILKYPVHQANPVPIRKYQDRQVDPQRKPRSTPL